MAVSSAVPAKRAAPGVRPLSFQRPSPPSSLAPLRPLSSFSRQVGTVVLTVATVTSLGVVSILALLTLSALYSATSSSSLPSSTALSPSLPLSSAFSSSDASPPPPSPWSHLRAFPFSYSLEFGASSVVVNGSIVTSSALVPHPVSGRLGWPILSLTAKRRETHKASRGVVDVSNVLLSRPTTLRSGRLGAGEVVEEAVDASGRPSAAPPSSSPSSASLRLLFPSAPHWDATGLTVEFQPALHRLHRVVRQAELRWWQSELREDSGEGERALEEGEEGEGRVLSSALHLHGVEPSDVDAAAAVQATARHRLHRLRAV